MGDAVGAPGIRAAEGPVEGRYGVSRRGTNGRAPVSTSSMAAKNSPAVFFATPASTRWPTPPTIPPTIASAS